MAPILNAHGLISDWQWQSANAHDQHFRPLIADHAQSLVKADSGFHGREGDPPNLLVCRRGQNNERMLVETTFSLWVSILGLKHLRARTQSGIDACLAWAIALFNLLAAWDGLPPRLPGTVMPSVRIAQFVI